MNAASTNKIVRFCDSVINWTILGIIFLVPLFFLPWTIEVAELNKQLIIVVGAAIAGLAWFGKMLAQRQFEYRRSIVSMMVILFAVVYTASALFSTGRYMSVVGDFGQEMAGLMTILAFVILYFVIVNNVRSYAQLSRIVMALVLSGLLTGMFALMQGLGIYVLPFEFAKTASFNTIGTAAALGMFLAFIFTLASGLMLADSNVRKDNKSNMAMMAVLAFSGVLSLVIIAVIDFWPVTVSLILASAVLIAFAFFHAKKVKNVRGVLLPISGFILGLILLAIAFPVKVGFPAEVMPSMKASYDIAVKTLREHPFLGSGPGTFIFDYAKHHSSDVNGTQFWNIRFDRGASSFLTYLATVGLLGTLSWLILVVFLLVSAAKKLFDADEESWHLLVGVFAAWILLVVSKFLYSSTITLDFLFVITTALLVVAHRKEFITLKFEQSPRAAMSVSFVFILSVVCVLSGVFVEVQRYAAEIAYADAIRTDRAGGSVDDVIKKLTNAVELNRSNDLYYRNLALSYLVKADKLFSEDVKIPQGKDEKKSDYDLRVKQAQQEKLSQASQYTAGAVNTAKRATEINGENVANWAIIASVYQTLMGAAPDAATWAVSSYEKAIELEPANPSFHTELGKVYLAISDSARSGLQSKDEQVKKDAQTKVDENLQKAVDEFNKAVALKADFAPARYNLALAFDRQNKLKEAITKLEEVVQLNPQDVGVGFQLSLMYFRDERKDDAIRLLEQVVAISPKYSNALWYLAAMYEEKGDKTKAIANIEKVKELNPGNDLVAKKLAELKGEPVPASTSTEPLPEPVEQPIENQNQPDVSGR